MISIANAVTAGRENVAFTARVVKGGKASIL